MTIRTRIEPIATFLDVVVRDDLSKEAQQKAIAEFARERLAEAQQANQRVLGRVPKHDTFVDGRAGAPLEGVKPRGGTIVFEFELFSDVLRWIMQTLIDRSPVVSGAYRRSHLLFADQRQVATDGAIPEADEYSFTNTVPYARKIEIGRSKSGRAFVVQVEPRIYERTADDAARRFGNIARIIFTWRGIVGGYQINQAKAASMRGAGRRAATGSIEKLIKPGAITRRRSVTQPSLSSHDDGGSDFRRFQVTKADQAAGEQLPDRFGTGRGSASRS